jgi:hypothetical protein
VQQPCFRGVRQQILDDFSRFWHADPEPAERRKLILSLFAQVWAKDNRIVAVKPNPAFANYFTAASEVRNQHPKADADDEATKAGATGVQPSFGTTSRSGQGLDVALAQLQLSPARRLTLCARLFSVAEDVTTKLVVDRRARLDERGELLHEKDVCRRAGLL